MAAGRRTEKMALAAAFRTASTHGPLEDLEADDAPVPFPRSGRCDDDRGGGELWRCGHGVGVFCV